MPTLTWNSSASTTPRAARRRPPSRLRPCFRRSRTSEPIFGANLFSAQGAAAAVKNANLQGVVKVASFDAPEQAIDDLRNGVVDIVIAQQPALIGATSVQFAFDALTGAEDEILPKVATPFVIITRDNVDTPEAQAAIYKNE